MPKKPQISNLKSHVGYHLRLVSNNVSQAFAEKLATHNVTVAEWVVMREMYSSEGSTSPSQVAEVTGLTRGAITKIIDKLLDKKWVLRKASTGDRRYQDIELTAQGNKLVPKLAELADINDAEFFSGLSRKEKKLLKDILQKIACLQHMHKVPIE